jgi:hypothetical protein
MLFCGIEAIGGGADYFEGVGDLGGGGFFDDFDRSSFTKMDYLESYF